MGSFHKNIYLTMEFLKVPFLALHFSYCRLMNVLMMLSVILLSMLMWLLSTLSVIRHLICGKNYNWLLNLNLINEALSTGAGSALGNSTTYLLCIFDVIGPSRSSLASLATLSGFQIIVLMQSSTVYTFWISLGF